MKFSLEAPSDVNQIHAYDANSITIKEATTLSLKTIGAKAIITNNAIITDRVIGDFCVFRDEDLLYLQKLGVELVLFTAVKYQAISPQTLVQFTQLGIGLEVMQQGAACRTFNLLAAEGRKIALII